ncbi:MAG: SDR family NAD(P)-dependent oxidoreductase [Planctomycetales bacterium]|nr:SDR family NAD(P)-dependent oxidoreductase [Planctomycetales bacterium]
MNSLKEKTVLVVGGGTGIGRGAAAALAAEGARVAIAGRRADKLQEVADAYAGEPVIACHPVDVTQRDSVAALVEWAEATLGRIDVLVHCAGINVPERTIDVLTPEGWDRVLATNATGAFNVISAVLPAMRTRRDGLIVNISSISGKRASQLGGVAYSAAKFAQTALGTAVGLELAHSGVRISNIYPGEVNTPILDLRANPPGPEHRAQILQPEDVAAAIVMIAKMPPRAHVSEMVIKPTTQEFA